MSGKLSEAEALALFLDALDEWGCEDSADRAKSILEFQASGYDLSAYRERPELRVIDGGRAALNESAPDRGAEREVRRE